MTEHSSALRRLATTVTGRLGRCGRCTSVAFRSWALATLLALVAWRFGPSPVLTAGLTLVALVLGMLWCAHAALFTLRSARATARYAQAAGAEAAGIHWPRRKLLTAFLRTLAFSALASSLPRAAFGQGCNCYTESDCYCPPDFPNCIFNPSTGESICCGPYTVGCAGPYSTWCCPDGTNCYGTDNQCY